MTSSLLASVPSHPTPDRKVGMTCPPLKDGTQDLTWEHVDRRQMLGKATG